MCFLKKLPNLAAPLVGVTVSLALCVIVFALSLTGADSTVE
jgi:hypothetical protein